MKRLIKFVAQILIWIAYKSYGKEGINALLLIMPAKLIAPTLRKHGATIGTGVEIHSPLIIHNASHERGKHYANLIIGNDCYLGRDILLDLKDVIKLDDYVTVSMRCTLLTHSDVGDRPAELINFPASVFPIQLKRGTYLGAGATILPGVTTGQKSTIAAGAVVTKDVPDEAVVAGVPARPLEQIKK